MHNYIAAHPIVGRGKFTVTSEVRPPDGQRVLAIRDRDGFLLGEEPVRAPLHEVLDAARRKHRHAVRWGSSIRA